MKRFKFALLGVCLSCFVAARSADATLAITFADGDTFEGDTPGSTAGPFTDTATGITGTITTLAVAPVGSVLNPNAGTLGINAPPGTDTAGGFDAGESWSYTWNAFYQFVGIDLGSYSTAAEDFAFAVQSPEWIGLSITPGSTNVVFNSATGTFTFDSGTAVDSDIFTSTDLYGAGPVPTNHNGRTITFNFTAAGQNATVEGMSFNLLIPEPSSVMLLGIGVLFACRRKSSA